MARKKGIRAGHKGSAIKIIHKIEDALGTTPIDKARLSTPHWNLSDKLDTIKALNAETIELIEDETALADEIEQADNYKEGIYEALLKIDQETKSPNPPAASLATVGGMAPASTSSGRVRLPKLQLRSFSGDITKWTGFWESFESAIHTNAELPDTEKFNYLNSLLEHSAQEAIAGLALTAANYSVAIETLQKRFGCKPLIFKQTYGCTVAHGISQLTTECSRIMQVVLQCKLSHS